MEKLNKNQFTNVLKDVRASYRLLAVYQRRLFDVVEYIGNSFNLHFNSGWSKFSNSASHGNRAKLYKWSWDWLTIYMYEFNMGEVEVGGDKYHFKIVHQGDTGFFDANETEKLSKIDVEQFGSIESSITRLFLVLSKNENGCPLQHILNKNLSAQSNSEIINGSWLAIPYNMERFINQESTDIVLKEFDTVCKKVFGINLIAKEVKL